MFGCLSFFDAKMPGPILMKFRTDIDRMSTSWWRRWKTLEKWTQVKLRVNASVQRKKTEMSYFTFQIFYSVLISRPLSVGCGPWSQKRSSKSEWYQATITSFLHLKIPNFKTYLSVIINHGSCWNLCTYLPAYYY